MVTKSGSSAEATSRVRCPLCQSEKSQIVRTGIRENPDKPVYICSYCKLKFIEPLFPNVSDLRDYYREQYRLTHDATPGKTLTSEQRYKYQHLFMRQSASKFKEHVPEGGSVLEIGCSAGGFLGHLYGHYDLYGLEWNPDDAAYVRESGQIPCEETLLADAYPGKTFSAIAAIHVLEHQPDPAAFINECKNRLIGGGWLYLEFPNANDALVSVYDSDDYKDFWYREAHLTYWHTETFASMMSNLGFEAQIMPMQRYGLLNHMSWVLTGEPMKDPLMARRQLKLIDSQHKLAPALNRILGKLDREYRVQMETLNCTDSLYAICRRIEI